MCCIQGLSDAQIVSSLLNRVDEHNMFVAAIASKDVPALSRLVRVAISQKGSLAAITRRIENAANCVYHVKSFSVSTLGQICPTRMFS